MLKARKRLVFDDFFYFTAAIQLLKQNKSRTCNYHKIIFTEECKKFVDSLSFSLTNAQKRVLLEIKQDLESAYTMNRLVQGDVGSGKTVLAELALLASGLNHYQGCFMAPTEVLAKQHFENLSKDLEPYGLHVLLLIGSMTAKEKRERYQLIESHKVDIIIGTHALITEKVVYHNLGLVITDEQHRFGVRQREALAGKGTFPHVLVMSATPIPRTYALTIYGDMDVSNIHTMPNGRLPVITTLKKNEEIREVLRIACAWEFVSKLADGIDSMIKERGGGFSEGQAQRLSIARALLRHSPILLLDEATSALDVATERRVLKNIINNDKPCTCIVTTHRPSVLSICKRVYAIKEKQCVILNQQEIDKIIREF